MGRVIGEGGVVYNIYLYRKTAGRTFTEFLIEWEDLRGVANDRTRTNKMIRGALGFGDLGPKRARISVGKRLVGRGDPDKEEKKDRGKQDESIQVERAGGKKTSQWQRKTWMSSGENKLLALTVTNQLMGNGRTKAASPRGTGERGVCILYTVLEAGYAA